MRLEVLTVVAPAWLSGAMCICAVYASELELWGYVVVYSVLSVAYFATAYLSGTVPQQPQQHDPEAE